MCMIYILPHGNNKAKTYSRLTNREAKHTTMKNNQFLQKRERRKQDYKHPDNYK